MKLASVKRIGYTVWGLVAALVVVVAFGTSYQLQDTRQKAQAEGLAQVTRFLAGAEAALNRSLLAVDILLTGTDAFLSLSTTLPQALDAEAASALLRVAASQNLMVRYVALVDEKGQTIASSEPVGSSRQHDLPTDFVDDAMAQPVSTLVVSAPVVSFTSSERVLYLGRHVRLADQSRLLAVAEVPTAMLTNVLMQGTDIAALQVTLERGRGQLLLGVTAQDARTEANLTPSLDTLMASVGGLEPSLARLTQVPALVVARPVLYRDLWITASIPLDAALADWRADRDALLALAAGLALLLVLAGAFIVAYLKRMASARLAIARSKNVLDQALESMVSGFLLLDPEHRVVQWNRRFEELFPWTAGTIATLVPFRSVLQAAARHHLPAADTMEHQRWVDARLLAQAALGFAHEQVLPSGRSIEITERATPDGGMVITYHDVTALRLASAEIETLAFYDVLTGLPNRRLLLDRLTQATTTASRSGQFGVLLFLDLDHFKRVNDTLGHDVGDQLLRQVAQRLKTCVRDWDTVARLGGDEFVVMLSDLSDDETHAAQLAQHIGEDMLRTLNRPYVLGAQPHRSTCSLGATLYGADAISASELLKRADIAMYQVKAQRGNALCFFDPLMQATISDRVQLEADLRLALVRGEFELHYQPQFSLDGRVVGAEALLRWRHPARGLVTPGDFIAVAEDSELIVPIGAWVLRTACQQLAAWQNDAHMGALQLSVNVSARQFRQPDFGQLVANAIREAGVQSHLLKLELTESLMLDNVDDCIAKMNLLKATGVRFSVDDFGTGYSSLAYLTRLPLDQLKIDQSFVRNLGVRHSDGLIVQTIIGMARSLGLEVIAEGVETVEQRELLAKYGGELYQGYLFAKPAPVAVLQEMMSAGAATTV